MNYLMIHSQHFKNWRIVWWCQNQQAFLLTRKASGVIIALSTANSWLFTALRPLSLLPPLLHPSIQHYFNLEVSLTIGYKPILAGYTNCGRPLLASLAWDFNCNAMSLQNFVHQFCVFFLLLRTIRRGPPWDRCVILLIHILKENHKARLRGRGVLRFNSPVMFVTPTPASTKHAEKQY